MSKIFWDHLVVMEEVEIKIKSLGLDADERQEIESLIDSTIHHRIMNLILTHLPRDHHEEFLSCFHKAPYDAALLDYLSERMEHSIEEYIKEEVKKLKKEILDDIKGSKVRNGK